MSRRSSGTGDGDTCPIDPAHGPMMVLNGSKVQYCADQSHDGVWGNSIKRPATPALWPYQFFAEAVKRYNEQSSGEAVAALPDIDMEALLA